MNLLDLLTRPSAFFAALREQPPRATRFVWVVLLTGLVTGLYSLLSQRPVQEAMGSLSGLPAGAGTVALAFGVVAALAVTVVLWLLLWGLGSLGAGAAGRPAEVFGAALLPSLLAALLLLPLAALFPLRVDVPPLNTAGLEGAELGKAIQQQSLAIQNAVRGQPLSVLANVLTYGAYGWMFYLAFVGFGVLTGERARALRGTLIPLGVFALLGLAFWLLGRALSGMLAGAA